MEGRIVHDHRDDFSEQTSEDEIRGQHAEQVRQQEGEQIDQVQHEYPHAEDQNQMEHEVQELAGHLRLEQRQTTTCVHRKSNITKFDNHI